MGASLIIGVDSDPVRLEMARRMGADVVLDFTQVDVLAEIGRLTGGGADVSVEALGTQGTFENALRCLRPGGTLSSLGVYSGKLEMPYDAFAAGLGGHRIVTTLCPGGKERMRRLIATVESGRFDPLPLITHRFALDDIVEAYDLFSNRRDGVLKVVITPSGGSGGRAPRTIGVPACRHWRPANRRGGSCRPVKRPSASARSPARSPRRAAAPRPCTSRPIARAASSAAPTGIGTTRARLPIASRTSATNSRKVKVSGPAASTVIGSLSDPRCTARSAMSSMWTGWIG